MIHSCFLLLLLLAATTFGFAPIMVVHSHAVSVGKVSLTVQFMSDGENKIDPEGSDLAAAFAMFAKESGVQLSDDDLLDEDEEDDEEEEDEEEEYKDADDEDIRTTLTNDQIYRDVKERVLDTAGGFVDFVKGASEDDDESDEELPVTPKVYQPPSTKPDPELTAGEVVELVLEALRHLDNPTPLYGMDVLFGYSSDASQIMQEDGLTPLEFTDYWKESEYKVLFTHEGVTIDKGDYSFDGKKAFYTALLKVGPSVKDVVPVNLILSNAGDEEDAWMVDSILIRPESMRRRRRK